jgi:recombinational DNA repair ATPase RecF
MSIDTLTIAGIRGIRKPVTLTLGGKSLLLRGDNGSGKSSIAQALRWALTGTGTSASAEPPPSEYFRHRLEKEPNAARVALTLSRGGAFERRDDAVDGDDPGLTFREACRRARPFLRRDEMLALLQDAPGARFKYFEGFLDLDPVDTLSAALNAQTKVAKQRVADLDRLRNERLVAARTPLPPGALAAPSAEEVRALYFAWAARLGLELPAHATWAQLARACERERDRARAPEARARGDRLRVSRERATGLVPPESPASLLRRLRAAQGKAREAEQRVLLERALEVVERRPSSSNCPVCEQSVDRVALAGLLRRRLAVLAEVKASEEEAERLADAWGAFLDDCSEIEREAACLEEAPAPRLVGVALLEHLDASARVRGAELAAETLTRLQQLRATLDAEIATLPDEEQAAELRALADGVRSAGPALDELERLQRALAAATDAWNRLAAADKAVSNARKNAAEDTLKGIGGFVARYYAAIHPPHEADEATGAPSIVVQRQGSGTAKLRGLFDSQPVENPQLVYSDGHLDSVGLCIFLALRRARADREGRKDPKLMVLDDIVMSIDLGHAERFVKVLRDEFADHQILLFSHNEHFMRTCERHLSEARRLHIRRWTLADGPTFVGHVSHVDALRASLETSGDNQALALAMLPVLESFLCEASYAFEVSLPAKTQWTMADYWGPLKKRLKELVRSKAIASVEAELEQIGDPVILRNGLAAHVNHWALETPLGTVQCVARGLLGLVDKLSCTRCRGVVRFKLAHDPSAGRACNCPKGRAPTPHDPCQMVACTSVEGA